jgi:hypothetical protein
MASDPREPPTSFSDIGSERTLLRPAAPDFARVLDYIGVTDKARARYLQLVVNPSRHEPWQEYYTDRLAASVYRAYERDFDKFSYPRTVK